PEDSGTQYRVIVTGAIGKDTSATAVLHVNSAPQITKQPTDTTVDWKGTAQFKVVATGRVTGYQWQSSTDGTHTSCTNIQGATSATLSLSTIIIACSGMIYRFI